MTDKAGMRRPRIVRVYTASQYQLLIFDIRGNKAYQRECTA